jgi:hypothetical protein
MLLLLLNSLCWATDVVALVGTEPDPALVADLASRDDLAAVYWLGTDPIYRQGRAAKRAQALWNPISAPLHGAPSVFPLVMKHGDWRVVRFGVALNERAWRDQRFRISQAVGTSGRLIVVVHGADVRRETILRGDVDAASDELRRAIWVREGAEARFGLPDGTWGEGEVTISPTDSVVVRLDDDIWSVELGGYRHRWNPSLGWVSTSLEDGL